MSSAPFPKISVDVQHVAPSDPSLPSLAVQVTRLVDSYMLWVGINEDLPEDVQSAPSKGNLGRDWACAMPSTNPNVPAPGTALFRTPSSDVALSMAQRLARRFKKQIFLSVDVPPAFLSMGNGHRLLLEVERALVGRLKECEGA